MKSRYLKALFAVAIVAGMSAAAVAYAAQLAPQLTQAGGVAIQVTPIEVGASAKEWTFAVALNTHTQSLADDLAGEAVIIDATGKARGAIGWDGDPPGGHHRKGVLRFAPLSPKPAQIELRIRRAAEADARTFRWAE